MLAESIDVQQFFQTMHIIFSPHDAFLLAIVIACSFKRCINEFRRNIFFSIFAIFKDRIFNGGYCLNGFAKSMVKSPNGTLMHPQTCCTAVTHHILNKSHNKMIIVMCHIHFKHGKFRIMAR